MTVRYAPGKLQRIAALKSRLYDLVREGALTREEANLTIAVAMQLGVPPRRVQCPACKKIHRLVGVADRFECCAQVRSVWDCAVG